jgi:hypothetical protein
VKTVIQPDLVKTSNSIDEIPNESNEFLSWLMPTMQSYCFIGLPESGKDYLCSLAAQRAKQLFGVKILFLDPKGDKNEVELWRGIADETYSFEGYETSSEDHANHIRAAFDKFKELAKRSKQVAEKTGIKQDRWLLIYNEFTTSALELKKVKDDFLAGELPKLIAMGSSLKMNFWLMAQSPQMNAGLDGSVMGLFARVLIIQPQNIGTMEGWNKAQLMTGINLTQAKRLFEKSEMKRVVFSSASHPYLRPVPRLKRPYYFCRETETWVGEKPIASVKPVADNSSIVKPTNIEIIPISKVIDIPETLQGNLQPSIAKSATSVPEEYQDIEEAIMAYFNGAKDKTPKPYAIIRNATSLRGFASVDREAFLMAMENLVSRELIEAPVPNIWIATAWKHNDGITN